MMSFTSSKSESSQGRGKAKLVAMPNSPASFADDKPLVEESDNRPRPVVPLQSSSARSSATFSVVSTYSIIDENERQMSPELDGSGSRVPLISEVTAKTWKSKWQTIWGHNKGIALVIVSQFFSALMNLATRLLETEGGGHEMHTFQVSIYFFTSMVCVLCSAS